MLPRLSRAPVGLLPGYKLLPQEVVFLCCISQTAHLFFPRRQCYQPTFPILLTYPPPYSRLTIPPVSPSSHTRTFTSCTQSVYPHLLNNFFFFFLKLSIQHFLHLLCFACFYSVFLHFPTLSHLLHLLFSFFFAFPMRVV